MSKTVKEIQLTNLVNIEGYPAGENGKLLVSLSDDLYIKKIVEGKKKDKDYYINFLITTAAVSGSDADKLAEHCDEFTSPEYVILVSKKFMKLSKKRQLILLTIENAKMGRFNSDMLDEHEVDGKLEAIEEFGYFAYRGATRKAARLPEKGIKKVGKKVHRLYKKDQKIFDEAEKEGEKSRAKSEAEADAKDGEFREVKNNEKSPEPAPAN